MPRVPIPLVRGEGRAASKFVSSRTLVNSFLEFSGGRAAIYGGPGFSLRQVMASGPIRGLHNFNDVLLVVADTRLYTVTEAGTATNQGEIVGTQPVVISDNGTQATIVSDALSYVWDGSTLSTITDPDFMQATSVAFIDQYMATSIYDTGRYQISALADATSYDALDVATAETRPDKLRRVFVSDRDLLLMGVTSIEAAYNSGDADFPFTPTQLFFDLGLKGRDCVASVDNSVAFLSSDGTVRIIRGGTPLVISTPAIANTIAGWSDPGSAQAFSFSLRNHQFWVLRHDDGCVVWDASAPPEEAWHVRRSYGMDTWRIAYAVNIWGVTVFGEADGQKLYTLDATDNTESSASYLPRELITEAMGPDGSYFTLNAVEVLIETGVGLSTGPDYQQDPECWLELSRNGGKTWGARMTRKLGRRGEYEKRIIWNGGFGQFRPEGGVIRLGISAPVDFVVKAAFADYTQDAA